MSTWLEERTGLPGLWRRFADHPVPGGARLTNVLPAVLVYLFVQQGVLGILLAAHYSPSATDAWASTVYLNDQIASGWIVRGLHHYGTSALLLATVAYLAQLAITREYGRPRELVWICTLGLLGVTMALGVTGNILPWDEQGYWAAQVELGIMEQTPGGGALRTVVQGGGEAGNLTLTRLFAAHAFVLPLVAAALLAGVVFLGRRAQRQQAERSTERVQAFASGQLLVDMLAMVLVAGALVAITIKTHGSELFAPADPTSGFQARPEWYFLFLYKLRTFFEGPMEPVATMVIPGAAVGFLVVAPFLDAMAGKVGRLGVLSVLGLMMAGVVGLTAMSVTSDASNESYQKAMVQARIQAERARGFATEGVLPKGGPAVFENDPEYKVRALYDEHCSNCHEVSGLGGQEAPSLTDYSSRQWLGTLVRDPRDVRFFGGTKHDGMSAYTLVGSEDVDPLSDAQLSALVEYLWRLQGEPDVDAALADEGATLWEDEVDCGNCHEVEPGAEGGAPNLAGHGSAAWVARVIRDSSQADLFGEDAQMPKFGDDKLTDEQLADLATFVVRQRVPPVAAQDG